MAIPDYTDCSEGVTSTAGISKHQDNKKEGSAVTTNDDLDIVIEPSAPPLEEDGVEPTAPPMEDYAPPAIAHFATPVKTLATKGTELAAPISESLTDKAVQVDASASQSSVSKTAELSTASCPTSVLKARNDLDKAISASKADSKFFTKHPVSTKRKRGVSEGSVASADGCPEEKVSDDELKKSRRKLKMKKALCLTMWVTAFPIMMLIHTISSSPTDEEDMKDHPTWCIMAKLPAKKKIKV